MFVPRKQSSKRRVRSQSDLNEDVGKGTTETATQALKTPSTTPILPKAGSSKSGRLRLRPTPVVPGYEKPDSATVNQVSTSRYSTQELESLRLGTASVASLPIVTAGVEHEAEQSVGASTAATANVKVTGADVQSASVSKGALAVDDDPPPPTPAEANEIYKDSKTGTVYRHADVAEPFSKQWDVFGDKDEYFMEQDFSNENDAPVVVVTDKDGAVNNKQLNSGSGSDSEHVREDNLWQRELLQRAGISATTASRLAQSERDRQDEEIVREMNLNGLGGLEESRLQSILDELESRFDSAAKDADAHGGKLERVQQTVTGCLRKVEEARQQEKKGCVRVEFYEKLKGDMEGLCRELRKHRKRMLSVRERRIAEYRKRGEAVEEFLRGGVDEYGRERRAGSGARWIEYDDGDADVDKEVQEIVKDMPVGLRSVYDVIARVAKWKELFGQDYEKILGDVGTGRMIGALATCERNVDWVVDVSDCQRRAALSVSDGIDEIEMFVRAKWRPSDRESCERVGKIVGCVTRVMDDGEKKTVVDVVRRRLDLEVASCDTSGDRPWREDVEKGMDALSQWMEIEEMKSVMGDESEVDGMES